MSDAARLMPGRIFSIVHWTSNAGSSPPKLGGVAAGRGSVSRSDAGPNAGLTHSSALTGTSPNLGEEFF